MAELFALAPATVDLEVVAPARRPIFTPLDDVESPSPLTVESVAVTIDVLAGPDATFATASAPALPVVSVGVAPAPEPLGLNIAARRRASRRRRLLAAACEQGRLFDDTAAVGDHTRSTSRRRVWSRTVPAAQAELFAGPAD